VVGTVSRRRFSVTCPKCRAEPFRHCRTLGTNRVTDTHADRVAAQAVHDQRAAEKRELNRQMEELEQLEQDAHEQTCPAYAALERVEQLCARWDALAKGEHPTTRAIREAARIQ
jgi:hypothetical protein